MRRRLHHPPSAAASEVLQAPPPPSAAAAILFPLGSVSPGGLPCPPSAGNGLPDLRSWESACQAG
eukprot:3662740-Alexandrium_andersonii.AAC.1